MKPICDGGDGGPKCKHGGDSGTGSGGGGIAAVQGALPLPTDLAQGGMIEGVAAIEDESGLHHVLKDLC